ncbi:tetratricopeptide repeat protein [Pedobacter frigoris]|uniref:Tetratricopeptide repeat protein n=1 Tax=Pedobacter frigoris TaxID=2571272 RepID=A0A4U1CNF0_9SPHI|nr:tetratricopeptide repeat protein [Pedobacter frigoris]TKC09461.1 tetratricopeptide repeat protein [Pedobacter frigoris]
MKCSTPISLTILLWLFLVSGPVVMAQEIKDDFVSGGKEMKKFSKPDLLFLQLKKESAVHAANGDLAAQALSLRKMAELCYHLGHYKRALEYYIDAAKLFEKTKDNKLLAYNYLELGTLHYYNRDTVQSGKCYKEAMVIFRKLKDQQGIATTLAKMGHLLEKKQQYKAAFDYQQRALKLYSAIADKAGMAKAYENLGSIYEDLARYEQSMSYFQSALQLYRETGEDIASLEVGNNIGDIYRKTNRYEKALQQYFEVLAQAKKQDEMYQTNSAYRDIAKTYHLMRKNDLAYTYSEESRACLLQIYSMEGNKQMAFIQALNDVERKNNEIRELQNARKINSIIIIAAIVVTLLLVFSVLLILSRQRIKLENLETQRQLMEADLRNQKMEETQLKFDIEARSKELSTQVLHVIQKNQLLENLKHQLEEIIKDEKRDQKKQLRQVIQQINLNFNNDSYWLEFRQLFEKIHHSFFDKLNRRFPGLTSTDLKLISLLKMNMDSGDTASMLAISQDSLRIARYRLRKKLNLDQGENLVAFLQSI